MWQPASIPKYEVDPPHFGDNWCKTTGKAKSEQPCSNLMVIYNRKLMIMHSNDIYVTHVRHLSLTKQKANTDISLLKGSANPMPLLYTKSAPMMIR